jgi:hypothetical protein
MPCPQQQVRVFRDQPFDSSDFHPLVGQTIALCGLPPAGSDGRRHKTIACPTETSLSEQHWF